MGNGILLVSDDPYGGRGILHVIDVRDPRNPRLLSTYSTWVPGLLTESTQAQPPPRARRHRPHRLVHPGLPLRLAGGVARGHRGGGPARPGQPALRRARARGRRHAASSSHDVQVDSRGLAWVAGGNGTAAYDTTDPAQAAAGHAHQPQRLARALQRLHPPQLAADLRRHAAGDRGGLRRRLPPRGLVPDLAHPRPHGAPAGPLRRGARRPAAGGLLGPLLRPPRRARGGRASTRPACGCST